MNPSTPTDPAVDAPSPLGAGESPAAEAAHREESLRQEAETLEIINRVGRVIAAELDLQKLVQAVTDAATELCGAQFGSFFYNVLDANGESYLLYTLSGVPREAFSRFPMPRNTDVFAHTFGGLGNVRLDDVRQDPRYGKNPPYNGMPKGHLPVVSYLAVPVISRSGEVIGGLFFGHEEAGRFTERHERIVTGLAAQAAIGIDNSRLYESAREQETRLRLATEAADIGTWDYHPETGALRWDARCKAIFGLPPDAEVTYETFLQGLHPEDREKADAAVQASLDPAGSGEFSIDYRVIGIGDGIERWAAAKGRSLFTEGERARRAVRFIGTIMDITESKNAEAERRRIELALRESETRYRGIVETALEGIWVVDTEWKTTFVNPGMAQMLGYSPEEMVGRAVTEFIAPDGRPAFEQRQRERRAGRSERFDCAFLRKDGPTVVMSISAAPLLDDVGQFVGAVAMMTDVTHRARHEIDQARLAAIVESSEDAIVSKDLNGIVTSWNKAAERMYGWNAEDIIGRSKALVIPADLPNELSNIISRIRAGERIEHYETRRIRKDGTIFDAAISVSPLKDSEGRIIGAATIVRDITERIRTERELRRKQAEVEALNERLHRSMRETHHRIKNNLQIMNAVIDMQQIEYRDQESVPLEELQRLGNHVHTLAVVHDLLTKGMREEEEDQRISSSLVLAQLLPLLEKTLAGREIRSQVEEVDLLSKQAVALSLTVNELVSNAVKHASGPVEVTFAADGPTAELSVCDDGEGFPVGFDPDLHANTGLDLVQGIARTDLKGVVYFENREEGGARVRVTFPLPANGAHPLDTLDSPEE